MQSCCLVTVVAKSVSSVKVIIITTFTTIPWPVLSKIELYDNGRTLQSSIATSAKHLLYTDIDC